MAPIGHIFGYGALEDMQLWATFYGYPLQNSQIWRHSTISVLNDLSLHDTTNPTVDISQTISLLMIEGKCNTNNLTSHATDLNMTSFFHSRERLKKLMKVYIPSNYITLTHNPWFFFNQSTQQRWQRHFCLTLCSPIICWAIIWLSVSL